MEAQAENLKSRSGYYQMRLKRKTLAEWNVARYAAQGQFGRHFSQDQMAALILQSGAEWAAKRQALDLTDQGLYARVQEAVTWEALPAVVFSPQSEKGSLTNVLFRPETVEEWNAQKGRCEAEYGDLTHDQFGSYLLKVFAALLKAGAVNAEGASLERLLSSQGPKGRKKKKGA